MEQRDHQYLSEAAKGYLIAQERQVLLVEDTAAHAAIIRRAVDLSLWKLEHVISAAEALHSFELHQNRIVLLDLSLPDGDGLQLLAHLRALNAAAPIVVITAHNDVTTSVNAMQRGAWDYVVKGEPKETSERITAALERAWRGRLQAAEAKLIAQAQVAELIRTQRLEAVTAAIRTICQEVNNPLTGVVALSQLLLARDNIDDELQELVGGILKSAREVADVVGKLENIQESPPQLSLPEHSPEEPLAWSSMK